ncbi:hypothetical protein DFH09DRAFT_1450503 [Mycena vulgaris]|nr:hypothetical protein DFH09DRAFT_1450503 [Mycena vulgaris]
MHGPPQCCLLPPSSTFSPSPSPSLSSSPTMFTKICLTLALAVSAALSLSVNAPSSVTSGGQTTITWNSTSSDPTFSIELVHPSFNNAFAIANSVDPTTNTLTLTIPAVPAEDGYTLQFVNVSDINQVYATSGSFAIGAEASSTASSSSNASATGGAGGTGSANETASATGGASGSGTGSVKPTSTVPSSASGSNSASGSAPSSSGTGTPSGAARTRTLPAGAAAIVALVGVARQLWDQDDARRRPSVCRYSSVVRYDQLRCQGSILIYQRSILELKPARPNFAPMIHSAESELNIRRDETEKEEGMVHGSSPS